MLRSIHRDDVFVPGGEPTITYVQREELQVERNLARAIATPNQIVALAGPTKTGKSVLCKKVLGEREFVWIDGGQISNIDDMWVRICNELNIPDETVVSKEKETSAKLQAGAVVTASGSRLHRSTASETHRIHTMAEALKKMLEERIVLVVDDFHYLDPETRVAFLRNIKGAVFRGLKVVLLSVTHRAFDAVKAETELTGRFISIILPEWNDEDLMQIAELGFKALRTTYSKKLIEELADEAQENPFLMQKFCWEICFDLGIEMASVLKSHEIPQTYSITPMCVRIAKDAGLPIYQQLVAGPQSRKKRTKRPLRAGGEADIYEATLLAIAETGPKSVISYEELRSSMNALLSERMPQKQEITSALKHLANIAKKAGSESAIDWDDGKREINVADPYLRFFLRWQIRSRA